MPRKHKKSGADPRRADACIGAPARAPASARAPTRPWVWVVLVFCALCVGAGGMYGLMRRQTHGFVITSSPLPPGAAENAGLRPAAAATPSEAESVAWEQRVAEWRKRLQGDDYPAMLDWARRNFPLGSSAPNHARLFADYAQPETGFYASYLFLRENRDGAQYIAHMLIDTRNDTIADFRAETIKLVGGGKP